MSKTILEFNENKGVTIVVELVSEDGLLCITERFSCDGTSRYICLTPVALLAINKAVDHEKKNSLQNHK